VNKGIVERGKDVSDAKDEFTFTDLGTESNLFDGSFSDLGSLLGLNRWMDGNNVNAMNVLSCKCVLYHIVNG
jgi:hypothetical protein